MCVCVCVLPLELMRLRYSTIKRFKTIIQWTEWDVKDLNYEDFDRLKTYCLEDLALLMTLLLAEMLWQRIHEIFIYLFNDLVVLHHFELLISTEQ